MNAMSEAWTRTMMLQMVSAQLRAFFEYDTERTGHMDGERAESFLHALARRLERNLTRRVSAW